MLWLACISALCISAAPIASAGESIRITRDTVTQPSDPGIRALLKLEDAWAAGVVRRDRALFERLLDARFVYTEDDKLMMRAEVIDGIASGTDTVTSALNEAMVVHRYSDATAVVTGWLTLSGRGPTGAFVRRFRFTDTWLRRGARWQVIAAHDYLTPTTKTP